MSSRKVPQNCRALPDITSGPEVWKNLQNPDCPECLIFFVSNFCFNFFFFLIPEFSNTSSYIIQNFWRQICFQGAYFERIDNPYLVCKMFENISLDLVLSGRTCPANLGVRSCPVRKLMCLVQLSPKLKANKT